MQSKLVNQLVGWYDPTTGRYDNGASVAGFKDSKIKLGSPSIEFAESSVIFKSNSKFDRDRVHQSETDKKKVI